MEATQETSLSLFHQIYRSSHLLRLVSFDKTCVMFEFAAAGPKPYETVHLSLRCNLSSLLRLICIGVGALGKQQEKEALAGVFQGNEGKSSDSAACKTPRRFLFTPSCTAYLAIVFRQKVH